MLDAQIKRWFTVIFKWENIRRGSLVTHKGCNPKQPLFTSTYDITKFSLPLVTSCHSIPGHSGPLGFGYACQPIFPIMNNHGFQGCSSFYIYFFSQYCSAETHKALVIYFSLLLLLHLYFSLFISFNVCHLKFFFLIYGKEGKSNFWISYSF